MKAHEPDAPIFTAYYDLLGWILDRVEKFPKSERFVLGQRLANHAVDVLELILTALYSRERLAALREANRKLQTIRVLLRLCCDRELVARRQYVYASSRLNEVGGMLGGWIKKQGR